MIKSPYKIILTSVILAFVLNLFFGRSLLANISTWPFLNKFNLLSPQAPIVINHREEIRLTDSGQVSDAVNAAKAKISTLLIKDVSGIRPLGAVVNLTSDGIFVAAEEVVPQKGELWLVLSDQRAAQVTEMAPDPASGLVFLKANIANVPPAPLADSKSFLSGEKLVYFSNNTDQTWEAWPDYLVRQENDRDEVQAYAGKISRSLGAASTSSRAKGKAVLNIKGEVAGLVSGNSIVPADEIKAALNLYILGQDKISRPDFDFTYQESLFVPESISALPKGQVVISPGKNLGLKAGDIIIEAGGVGLTKETFLEEILEKYKVGDSVNLKLKRGSTILEITIKAKELK